MRLHKFSHVFVAEQKRLSGESEVEPIDNKKYPIVVSFDDRCLIWDETRQDWRIKKINPVSGAVEEILPKEFCTLRGNCPYCGSKIYINDTLPPSYDKRIIESFNETHKTCGKKRISARKENEINFQIQEGADDELSTDGHKCI